jgi:hypothetical protein
MPACRVGCGHCMLWFSLLLAGSACHGGCGVRPLIPWSTARPMPVICAVGCFVLLYILDVALHLDAHSCPLQSLQARTVSPGSGWACALSVSMRGGPELARPACTCEILKLWSLPDTF